METTDLYRHKHFKDYVQITATAGSWVEFLDKSKNKLLWLEQLTFEHAYTYVDKGDPIVADLQQLRDHARTSSILIPKEFNYR